MLIHSPEGIQHIVEFIDCCSDKLSDIQYLTQSLNNCIINSGLTPVKIISHGFTPVGVSIVAIISESHIGMHTFPESNHISLDIFTLSDAERHKDLIKMFAEEVKPTQINQIILKRGKILMVIDQ